MLCLCFYNADTKKEARITKSKGLNLLSLNSRCVFTTTVYICVNGFGALPGLWILRWHKARAFQEKLNRVKLAGLDKAITLLSNLKRTHYFVLERTELYC